MRRVIVEGSDGWKRVYLVRDEDDDSKAESIGIRANVPDVEGLPWDEIKRELNNALIERGLLTWEDLQKAQSGLQSVIVSVLTRPLKLFFKVNREVL